MNELVSVGIYRA